MNNYIILKQKAINLRKKGYSFKEIAGKLNVAKSTSSLWSRDVKLKKSAIKRLKNNSDKGRQKSLEIRTQKIKNVLEINKKFARESVKDASININTIKIFCSLLYWGEGSKLDRCLRFTNSDPKMISTFLSFFRKGFPDLDESKFRCILQIHDYHNENQELNYWSKLTKIPTIQFTKSYIKSHTGTILRPEYHGTIGIKYYDSNVVDRMIAIYNTLSDIGV